MSKPKPMASKYPVVRYNGRKQYDFTDSLETRPLSPEWQAGEEREFTPAFCAEHGRQCGQLPGTEPCADGDDCTCWAAMFAAAQNINADKNAPWFTLIEPDHPTTTADTAAKE